MGASDDASGAKTRARGRPRRNGEESIQWTDAMAETLFKLRYTTFASFFANKSLRLQVHDGWTLVASHLGQEFGIAIDVQQCRNKLKSVKTRCLQFAKQNALMGGNAGQMQLPHSVAIMRQYCGDDAAFLTPETAVVAAAAPSTRASTRQSAREDTAASFHYIPGRTAAQVETPDDAAQGKKKRGRPRLDGEGAIQWTDELTDRLVQLRFETFAAEFDETKSMYRLRVVWTALAAQLGDEFGVQLGPEQCKSKTKALTSRWAQYCESINETNVAAEPHWVQTMRRYCGDSEQLEQPVIIPQGSVTEAGAVARVDLDNDDDNDDDLETPSKKRSKHDSGVKEKSLKWTLAMTERLFELRYKTMAAEFDRSQNKYRLRDAWKGLALQLSADCGFTIDVEHCRNKIKAMKTKWGGEFNEQTFNAGNENNDEQGDWAGIWRRYCGDGGDAESNDGRSTTAGLYEEARAANPARAGMPGDNNTTPLPPTRRSSLNSAITRELRSPVVPARWGRRTTNGSSGNTRNNVIVSADTTVSGDENSKMLAQILRAVEEQKAAALAQTQSIQELLQFLREDFANRQGTVYTVFAKWFTASKTHADRREGWKLIASSLSDQFETSLTSKQCQTKIWTLEARTKDTAATLVLSHKNHERLRTSTRSQDAAFSPREAEEPSPQAAKVRARDQDEDKEPAMSAASTQKKSITSRHGALAIRQPWNNAMHLSPSSRIPLLGQETLARAVVLDNGETARPQRQLRPRNAENKCVAVNRDPVRTTKVTRPRGRPRRNGGSSIQWNAEMVDKLVKLRDAYQSMLVDSESPVSMHAVWTRVATEISAACGVQVNYRQCSAKFDILKARGEKLRSSSGDRGKARSAKRKVKAPPRNQALMEANGNASVKRRRRTGTLCSDGGDDDHVNSGMLVRILQTLEEQRDATHAQTESIHALLALLRDERRHPETSLQAEQKHDRCQSAQAHAKKRVHIRRHADRSVDLHLARSSHDEHQSRERRRCRRAGVRAGYVRRALAQGGEMPQLRVRATRGAGAAAGDRGSTDRWLERSGTSGSAFAGRVCRPPEKVSAARGEAAAQARDHRRSAARDEGIAESRRQLRREAQPRGNVRVATVLKIEKR